MFKRFFALILSLLLLVSLFAGCSSKGNKVDNTETTSTAPTTAGTVPDTTVKNIPEYLNINSTLPLVKEGKDITIKFVNAYTSGFLSNPKDIWFWKFVEEYCGFKVEVENIFPDAVEERINLMFVSRDLPDILFNPKIDTTKVVSYGVGEKLLLPINDYITDEIMPNYKAFLEKYPKFRSVCTAPDGNMYSFGRKLDSDDTGAMWRTGLNQNWLDKLGQKSPETIDEFIDLMRIFKSTNPATLGVEKIIPMSGGYTSYPSLLAFLNGMGYLATGANDKQVCGATIAVRNGEVCMPCLDDIYGDYVALCKLAYDEGLISPDFFTKDRTQCNAELGEEIVGYVHTTPYAYATGIEDDYLAIKPLTSKWNDKPVTLADNPYWVNDLFISADTKYPELCCRFVDIFYSEYAFLFNNGPDVGTEFTLGNDKFALYEYNEKENKYQLAQYIADMDSNEYAYKMQYLQPSYTEFGDISIEAQLRYNEKVRGNASLNDSVLATAQQKYEFYKKNPKENAVEISYHENLLPYRAEGYMQYTYRSESENQMLLDLKTVFEPYIIEQFALFVTGARPLEEIEKFQNEIRSMEIEKYLQFHIDEFARTHAIN